MAADVGVLLPLRIETRFRNGDLHLLVVPDEPWFVRHDPRISAGELTALRRYVGSGARPGPPPAPAAWRELAAHVGAARAVFLHRTYVTADDGGELRVRDLQPGERREQPALPRIVGFPATLRVYLATGGGAPRAVLDLNINRDRLLADLPDPDIPGDRRWWQSWDEARDVVGVGGIIPAAELGEPIDALYVVGVGDDDPAELFTSLAAEGRLGLLTAGTPTNSVDGGAAAALHNDADTWWQLLRAGRGPGDTDLSAALTGDRRRLGPVPGGRDGHRRDASAFTTALWPALWGFAAGQVYDLARGREPARWAGQALYPEGPYPTLRVGPQPYALLPVTWWQRWTADPQDPPLEAPLVRELLQLRAGHAEAGRARGTVTDQSARQLLELLAHTPVSPRLRYRPAWPLHLWWLAAAASDMGSRWHEFVAAWDEDHPLAAELGLRTVRRYGARGEPKPVGLPLVVPDGTDPVTEFPVLLRRLAEAAVTAPATFADTARVDAEVLGRPAHSLLLRLVIRSLQLLIADIGRGAADGRSFPDPEPLLRRSDQPGRLQELIAGAAPVSPDDPRPAVQHLLDVTGALGTVAEIPVADLDRMVRAAVDTANHRIDPWFVAVAQRRLDTLQQDPQTRRRLGAYGWVDNLRPGNPGPTAGGLVHAPSPGQALTAAVLRDRAITTTDQRWDLDITSRRARIAYRVAEHVRVGADLPEALGREVERVIASTDSIERLRRDFPVRAEHAGRRVCDGGAVLRAANLPVPLSTAQQAQLTELREAVDVYGDLLVAEAVHHLTEGRSDIAGAVMDGAAGLNRPPELNLLRTPRQGRSVSTAVAILLPREEPPELPDDRAERAVLRPTAVLDASAARFLTAMLGRPIDWEFLVDRLDDAGTPAGSPQLVTLADLNLPTADALALTRTDLDRLARERVADPLGLPADSLAVVGGTAGDRYERGVRLTGLLGRTPAGTASVAENDGADDSAAVITSLVGRFLAVRAVGVALAAELQDRLAPAEFDAINHQALNRLMQSVHRWGIAPDPPAAELTGAGTAAELILRRRVAAARRALAQLEERLARAPATGAAARELGRDGLLAATTALVCPTGHLVITGELRAAALPPLERGRSDGAVVDADWLTVAAAARPRLASLEAHQLTVKRPLAAWTNRPEDFWQQDTADQRRFVAVYAQRELDLSAPDPEQLFAVAALDRFTEVIPDTDQLTGAAFGFDAPASRAPQAILLVAPPATHIPLDPDTVVGAVAETRELAHARMARPVDLPGGFRGLVPAALLPATGSTATPLEAS